MGYASKAGRARVSASNPQSQAVCDRCAMWYNWVDLKWQYDWRGAAILNTRILVCNECYDVPQEQLRAIVIPADPTPIINARVEPFLYDSTEGTTTPYGQPIGLEQPAIMPLNGKIHYGVMLPILSVISNGTNVVNATCSAGHGMTTDDQISVTGLSNKLACGFFSVVVTTATAFTYQTFSNIPAGSLFQGDSRIVTAKIGLPRGYTTIPQVGP